MFKFSFSLIIFTMLILNLQPTFADSNVFTSSYPYYNYHQPYQRYHNPEKAYFSDLNALEKYTFNRNYNHENELQRLQRLELQAFGAIQQGDIHTRYENVRSAILSRPKENYKTSFLRNLGNYLSGQMTGFTPSLESLYNNPYYSNSGFAATQIPTNYGSTSGTEYFGPFRSGYHINNFGTGSASGVRILD